jgi:lipoprotein NlpD
LSCIVGFGCAVRDYQPQSYVVRPGDTLYSIAWRHDLDYRELARWNDIGPDFRISVGQVLMLKPSARAAAHALSPPAQPRVAAPAPRVGAAPAPPHSPPPASSPSAGPRPPARADVAPAPSATGWSWPTASLRAPTPVPGGGILLFGELGQPVRAANSGRVVYVGSGIRGYGNLVIIKHGESLLSAYAHARELDVREGEDVRGGQVIAQMGTGPHQIAALYFEIRLNGKPVDPLPYLGGTK